MPPRNQKKPCHNCPQPKAERDLRAQRPVKKGADPLVAAPPSEQPNSVPVEEGLKLWRHVLFGTNTCIDMIEGYSKLGMPGDPTDGVKHLRNRLNQIINNLEARS